MLRGGRGSPVLARLTGLILEGVGGNTFVLMRSRYVCETRDYERRNGDSLGGTRR